VEELGAVAELGALPSTPSFMASADEEQGRRPRFPWCFPLLSPRCVIYPIGTGLGGQHAATAPTAHSGQEPVKTHAAIVYIG